MPDEVVAHVRELMDRQQILDAVMRYCRGVDRSDSDLINSAFHDDAEVAYQAFKAVGNEIGPTIVNRVHQNAPRKMAMHSIFNHLCRIDGDVANAETYFVMWGLSQSDSPERLQENGGRYLDRFERRNGEWRIAEREVVWDWRRTTDMPEPFMTAPGRPRGSQSREDPSYRFLPYLT